MITKFINPYITVTSRKIKLLASIGTIIFLLAGIGLSLNDLHEGESISLPVTVKIDAPADTISNVTINSLSRSQAKFPFEQQDTHTWKTDRWITGIEINSEKIHLINPVGIEVWVGDQVHRYSNLEVSSKEQSSLILKLDSINLQPSNESRLSFFSKIINWPGDFSLVFLLIAQNFFISLGISLICTFIFSLVLAYLKHLPQRPVSNAEQSRFNQVLILFFCLTLSLSSILFFVLSVPTAFDWPAMDMGPFFEYHLNSEFLKNDLFTQSSAEPNPRFVFGFLILSLVKLFNTDWYTIIFSLKVIVIAFTPPLLFLAIKHIFDFVSNPKQRMVIYFFSFLFILASLFKVITGFFSIALWGPHMLMANAHGLSFAVALLAIVINQPKSRKISYLLWFTASLIHPAIGGCILIFYLISRAHRLNTKHFFWLVLSGIVTPFLTLLLLFYSPEKGLSASDFVYHYITLNHAFHYLPSYFIRAGESFLPWQVNFALICSILTLGTVLGKRKKDQFLFLTSLLGLLFYAGSILISYLFIELYPIKMVAIFGPSRFTMMGYWLVTLLVSYWLSAHTYKHFRSYVIDPKIDIHKWTKVTISIAATILILLTPLLIDNPKQTWEQENPELTNWIKKSTPAESVFVSNVFELNIKIPLFSERAIYTGNGFPFHEKSFESYNAKRSLLFGNPDDWKISGTKHQGIGMSNVYRSKTPNDFYQASLVYRLDYAIIENDFSSNFSSFTPRFKDDKVSIYAVTDFKDK